MRRTIVFAGDSVTDCGRREDPDGLGNGYVRLLAGHASLTDGHIINAGVGGDRLEDLAARWQDDILAADPGTVSLLIGINDTWRTFDSGQLSDLDTFADRYRGLLGALDPATRVILMEPFVLPTDPAQQSWRSDVDARIDVVHRLAVEFGATLVRTQRILDRLAGSIGAAALAADGVHPTSRGHREIAAAWISAVQP